MITTQTLNKIKTHAHSSGACDLIRDVQSEAELFDLVFSAQGREWIKGASEPTLRALTRLLEEASDTRYIHLDKLSAPYRHKPNATELCFVGKSPVRPQIRIELGERYPKIILLLGAEVDIHLSDYVIVSITETTGARAHIVHQGEYAHADYD